MTEIAVVFIAEEIWFQDNPGDGRRRPAVCAGLDDALHAVRVHRVHGDPDWVATETTGALAQRRRPHPGCSPSRRGAGRRRGPLDHR